MGFFTGIKKSSSTRDERRGYAPMACRYCGMTNVIGPCGTSPTGLHEIGRAHV